MSKSENVHTLKEALQSQSLRSGGHFIYGGISHVKVGKRIHTRFIVCLET